MQAVVTGRRAGATYAFLANAATAPSEETAPWLVLEEQVVKLRADAAMAARWFENSALGCIGTYFAALQKEGAGRIKAWLHEYPDRLARARWLYEWPKACNVKSAE
jgi:trans-aconitate methyltransferase